MPQGRAARTDACVQMPIGVDFTSKNSAHDKLQETAERHRIAANGKRTATELASPLLVNPTDETVHVCIE